jgi:gamma-glutamyl-gamma-aminobutyrate hydrolase PuuD
MKLVGISQRVDFNSVHQETRDCLDQRWWNFLKQCDLIPIVLPNNLGLVNLILENIVIEGRILTGGNETPERNDVENYLIKFSLEKKIPLIGVCHGMQMIQKYFNVSLYPVANQVNDKQEVIIHEKLTVVNSYHDYGTYEHHEDFEIFGKSKDGIIKAIKHKFFPVFGIMWHPERYQEIKELDYDLFGKIFK